MTPRYKRGDKHPSNAGLFFWRYNRGKEVWILECELKYRIDNALDKDRVWKKTLVGRACAKRGWTAANHRNKQKMADYYTQPVVRQRRKYLRDNDPRILARREARLKWREERASYRASDEFKAIQKERNARNWAKRKAAGKTREYDRNKWRTNLQHRLGSNMRRLIHSVMVRRSGHKKAHRTFELIGCSIEALKVHLESQFTPEMSWENYGTYWEVDHKFPLARFDLTNPVQQKLAFHFENLQPLEAIANRKKSDKVEGVPNIIPFKAA